MAMEAVTYPPIATLFLGYARKQVAHALDGFGVLVPASEHRRILGVIFSSTLFEGRAPAGHVALTVLAGGMLQPEAAAGTAEDQLALVREDLRDLLGVRGEPVFIRHRLWPRAIPQYALGFERQRLLMAACEQEFPALLIGGSARDGISVGHCIESGFALARRAGLLAHA
jgi:oxygen-dependent protoporphyrinogen oxidase